MRALRHDEIRYAGNDGVSYIHNQSSGERRAVLPRGVGEVRMLILGLDEGSIGSAGVAAAAFKLNKLVWARFDKIHRVIRDLKLAENHACCKVFEKAKLWSAYLYGMNNRPFGSGAIHSVKERLLNTFQIVESVDSPLFQRYVHRAAKDFDLPCDSRADQERIFAEMTLMKSFTHKLAQPKVSNWFAWNSMAEQQIREFHGQKCIYHSVFPDDPDPDADGPFDAPTANARTQLNAILKGGGGLGLAFKLMKTDLQKHVKIMHAVEQPAWSFYTDEVEATKSPRDGFKYTLRMAGSGWEAEKHLWQTLETLQKSERLRYMGIAVGESTWATKAMELALHIVMRRAWSLAKHSMPPDSLAGLLAPTPATRDRTAQALRVGHNNFLLLERRGLDLDDAAGLRKDLIFLDSVAVRVAFEFFARDGYNPESVAGRNVLMGHLCTLADNKLVEDIHQPLRLNARANQNKKMSSRLIQDIILTSEVFEKRGITHSCQVTKAYWVAKLKGTKFKKMDRTHRAALHKLPKHWSQLMRPNKDWATVNEESLQRAAAGWQWLTTYMRERGVSLPADTRIGDAVMSKFVPACVILKNVIGGNTFVSFGNRKWAVLAWPLTEAPVGGEVHYAFRKARVKWLYVVAPEEWQIIRYVSVRSASEPFGLVLKASAPPQSLIHHALTSKNTNSLTNDDLLRVLDRLRLLPLDVDPGSTRALLGLLAAHFNFDIEVALAKFRDTTEDEGGCIINDPLAEAQRRQQRQPPTWQRQQ